MQGPRGLKRGPPPPEIGREQEPACTEGRQDRAGGARRGLTLGIRGPARWTQKPASFPPRVHSAGRGRGHCGSRPPRKVGAQGTHPVLKISVFPQTPAGLVPWAAGCEHGVERRPGLQVAPLGCRSPPWASGCKHGAERTPQLGRRSRARSQTSGSAGAGGLRAAPRELRRLSLLGENAQRLQVAAARPTLNTLPPWPPSGGDSSLRGADRPAGSRVGGAACPPAWEVRERPGP